MNHTYDHSLTLHILFIEFRPAFDSIKRSKLIEVIKRLQIPIKLKRLTKMTLKGQ